MTGIKKISWLIQGDYCPNYRKDKEDDKRWTAWNQRHEEMKKAVLRKLTSIYGRKIKCEEECLLENGNVRGKIDLLCWTNDELVLVEVKSYRLNRAASRDALQLLMYGAYLKDRETSVDCNKGIPKIIDRMRNGLVKMGLLLAYKDNSDNPVLVTIDNDYLDRLDVDEFNSLYSGASPSASNDLYVIGPWCYTCSNNSCPIRISIKRKGGN